MVYFLKFVASFILPPGIFIVILFVLSAKLYSHADNRWDDRLKNLSLILAGLTFIFYLLCTGFVAEKTLGYLENFYQPPEKPDGDVIIMLGGGAMSDVPDVDGVGSLCSSPANRLLTAVRLQKNLHVPILLSGGQVYSDTGAEAKIAGRILESLGVESKDVIMETESVNTTQNAAFTKKILAEHDFKKPILVTSAFHMRRAVLAFEQEGIKVTPYPADYFVPRNPVFHYTKLRPTSEALFYNVTFLQESLRTFVTWTFRL